MVMVVEEVVNHLPPRGNGSDDGDDDGDGGGDDSPPLSDHGQPRHHQDQRDRWVYIVQ